MTPGEAVRIGDAAMTGDAKVEGPQRIGGLVGALLDRLGIAERVHRARAAAAWKEIVGPHIARVTGRTSVRGRTLFVEVESAAWLSELNMRRHDLLERINGDRSRGRIERIVFVQSDGPGQRPERERREDRDRDHTGGRGR